ncbi:MAG: hypothetical protein KDC58_01590 [Cyclobacteriaceae bacterium]|nr:hypothetical protein [Cyclobacteriaceae bacterium]
MFKNILRFFLLVLLVSAIGTTYASVVPDLMEREKKEVKIDSLTVKEGGDVVKEKDTKSSQLVNKESKKTALFEREEEVEEDTTSNSALSFNFIYYIIENFKFQVE